MALQLNWPTTWSNYAILVIKFLPTPIKLVKLLGRSSYLYGGDVSSPII